MNYELFDHEHKQIFLVNMSKELTHDFSLLTQKVIEKHLRLGKKIWILVNKKGYAHGLICHDCGHVPQCKRCSVSIHYHKILSGDQIGLCHICKTQYSLPAHCEKCGSKNVKDFGMGTQKVADYLEKNFGAKSVLLESETGNSEKKIERLLAQLVPHVGQYPILIWTSLLTSPIPSYPLDVLIVLNADLGLNIPDYTAASKNFHLLYDLFTKHSTTHYVVQTFDPEQYSIRMACRLDEAGFTEQDNEFRKAYNYPPFTDLCVIMYKNEIEDKVFAKVDKLHKELLYLKEKYQMPGLEIYTTPPLIYKMFGKYRYNIILKGPDLRNFMDIVFSKLNLTGKQFKVDWQAESIV